MNNKNGERCEHKRQARQEMQYESNWMEGTAAPLAVTKLFRGRGQIEQKEQNRSTKRSSLIYNTSARHERHECGTNATWGRHEWDTSDTSATQVQHECYMNYTSATQVKNFDFDNYTSKNIFSHPYIYFTIWKKKDYKERNNFIFRTNFGKSLVSMPKCV